MTDAQTKRPRCSRRRWKAATPKCPGVSPTSRTAQGTLAKRRCTSQRLARGFEALLAKHPLAFADHGAEFYLGSGGDPARAFELAQLNLANRPTLRAFEQTHSAALAAGEVDAAAGLREAALQRREKALIGPTTSQCARHS